MSSERTVPSKPIREAPPSAAKRDWRNSWWVAGGLGCLLGGCIALLLGSLFFAREPVEAALAGWVQGSETRVSEATTTTPTSVTVTPSLTGTVSLTPTVEITGSLTPQPPVTETITATATTTVTVTIAADETEIGDNDDKNIESDSLPVSDEPEIGDITFALDATADSYEPVDAGETFEAGVTEIHAIFDYSGMSNENQWERVWYLDGQEILRNKAQWAGQPAGRFDYFIDADGEPLFPGEWRLELYVEEELLAVGNFTIAADEEADDEIAAEATAPTVLTQATRTPTPRPTTPTREPSPAATRPGTPRPSDGGTYRLLFTRWDGGQHHLYVADTNGDNERFLLRRAAGPSWTPDGDTIFFYGEEGVDRQLVDGVEYIFDGISNGLISMDASPLPRGMDQISLFQGLDWKQGTARWARVSPNGQMVAFDARPGSRDYRIFFLGTDDNQQFRYEILGEQAAWSPDSDQIVYRSGRDGQTGLWISNRDDTGHTLLIEVGSASFPTWSPDGQTIAISREVDGNIDIYTIDIDGSNLQRLTTALGQDTLPVYTPSGDLIFRSVRSGQWAIWKMSGTGDNQTEIIPEANVGPDWAFSRMSVN